MNIKLYRFMYDSNTQGTPGILIMKSFRCMTLELPWYQNKTSISCIPPGEYEITYEKSSGEIGGRKDLYLLHDTEPRTGIFIHAGNYAGDKALGYKSNSYGCILLGRNHTVMDGQGAITASRPTIEDFTDVLDGRDAVLSIVET